MRSSLQIGHTLSNDWQHKYNLKQHQQRLQSIQKEKPRYSLSPKNPRSFIHRSYNEALILENQKILDRLIKISRTSLVLYT